MDIRLESYRVFSEVAKSLNFSKAAQNLFMTQSAVSQSIKNLETALDTKLFVRSSKGVRLTTEGETLLQYTSAALGLIESGETALLRTNNLQTGQLRIAANDTVSNFLLMKTLEVFHQTYPGVSLKIFNRTSVDSLDLLKSGQVDMAFLNLPLEDPSISIEPFCQVHDIFVAGHMFSYLKEQTISLKTLEKLPLIFLERTSNSRRYIDDYFIQNNVQLHPAIELASHHLLLEFAKAGLGISSVTEEFCKTHLNKKEVFVVQTEFTIPPRFIGVGILKNMAISPAGEKFIELAKEINQNEIK